MPPNKLLAAACGYAKLGWSVILIEPGGKKPLVKWEKSQQTITSKDQIKKWWSQHPNGNIGIATGSLSKLIVIDIDSVVGREQYIAQFGELHNTISQQTGKPGAIHLFFAHPGDRRYHNMAGFLPDVDIRADGGYVVVPPSVHPNGKTYQWDIDPIQMGLDDLLPLPEEIKTQLFAKTTKKTQGADGWIQEALMGVDEGRRNDTCTRLAGYYLRAFKGDVEQTEILLASWNERNIPPMDWKEIRSVIKSVAKREGRNVMGDGVGEKIEKIQILEYPPPDDTRRYKVYLTNHKGSVEMSVSELVIFTQFKMKFTELTRKIPKQIKQLKWEDMVNQALAEAEVIKMSVDESLTGLILRIVNTEVFSDGVMHDLEYIDSHFVLNDDVVYFRMETLLSSTMIEREKISRRDIGKTLRSLGFKNDLKKVRGSVTRCWHREMDEEWKNTCK